MPHVFIRRMLGIGLAAAGLASAPALADESPADRLAAIADATLEHHVVPPARQEMVLHGLRAAYEKAGLPAPDHLARRVSATAGRDQEAALIAELWPKEIASGASKADLDAAFVEGVLRAIPGPAQLMTQKEYNANQQIAGNRYIGLQIAVAYDDERKLTVIKEAFKGGPADQAGMKEGDLIESVDGEPMKGVPLREVIERLRGDEGTSTTVVVRQPDADDARTLTVRREARPREVVKAEMPEGSAAAGLSPTIGYLRVEQVAGSTLHELRKHEARLRSEGKRALLLDLRGCFGTDPHAAVLVADGLLDEGPIGRVRTTRGGDEQRSDADCLFRGWPMVVLVDGMTSGPAEWLAAALKDRGRAALIGLPTRGARFVHSSVKLPDGQGWLLLMTGILERAGGRPLCDPPAEGDRREPAPPSLFLAMPVVSTPPANTLVFTGQGVRPDVVVEVKDRGYDKVIEAMFREAVKRLGAQLEAAE